MTTSECKNPRLLRDIQKLRAIFIKAGKLEGVATCDALEKALRAEGIL